MRGSLHTVANFQVPYNEGNVCNKLGTASQGQTVGSDKGNGEW